MQHVAALVFDGKRTASKVLDALEEQATPGTRKWVDDVAVVSRGKHGFVRVNSTWAEPGAGPALRFTSIGVGFVAVNRKTCPIPYVCVAARYQDYSP